MDLELESAEIPDGGAGGNVADDFASSDIQGGERARWLPCAIVVVGSRSGCPGFIGGTG